MTYDEASREAVLGARITSNTIGEGWYVDYQFNGWRIVSPNGSHSGFRPTEADEAAEWSIVDMEPPKRIVIATGSNGWGKTEALRRIELGEAGVPAAGSTLFPPLAPSDHAALHTERLADTLPQGTRYAREPSPSNVGKSQLSGFELAQLEAEALKEEAEAKVDKWGQPVKPSADKWGRQT